MEEKREKNYRLINMEDVQAREVNWLWYPYIPYGKLTIVQGDPGEGKTTFILHLAALLTNGETLPCEENTEHREPVNVIYQNAEDSLEDTIKPRLLEAGADCHRVLVIDESVNCLCMTDERLVRAIKETGAKMVVLDPIQAYLGADVDMHRANEIRPVLKQLGNIAEEYGCAIILIGHMNKASGSKSTYRGLGSIDFQATARSVLVVGRIKDDATLRVIAHDKSSLAPEGTSIAFRMDKENGFTWEGAYDVRRHIVVGDNCIHTLKRLKKQLCRIKVQEGILFVHGIGRKKHSYRSPWSNWINIWGNSRNIRKSCIRQEKIMIRVLFICYGNITRYSYKAHK